MCIRDRLYTERFFTPHKTVSHYISYIIVILQKPVRPGKKPVLLLSGSLEAFTLRLQQTDAISRQLTDTTDTNQKEWGFQLIRQYNYRTGYVKNCFSRSRQGGICLKMTESDPSKPYVRPLEEKQQNITLESTRKNARARTHIHTSCRQIKTECCFR